MRRRHVISKTIGSYARGGLACRVVWFHARCVGEALPQKRAATSRHGQDGGRAAGVPNAKEYAMTAIEAPLIEQVKKLPPGGVAEVLDFVDFLAAREERAAAANRLTQGLARLDALNLPPISEDEVEAEIQGARQQRRAKHDARSSSAQCALFSTRICSSPA